MGSAVLAMDQYEVVDKLGFRYQITKLGASDFATIIAGAQKRSNWVRCVDPLHEKHHVTEGGWQGAYNVRFIERLDPRTQAVIGYKHIWSAPKHNLREFYDACREDWPELPAFNTFRQAVQAAGRKMRNFSVQRQPDIELTRMRCPLIRREDQPGLPVAAVAAAPRGADAGAGGAAAQQVRAGALKPGSLQLAVLEYRGRL